MTSDFPTHGREERCGECPIGTSRRLFLRDAALTVVAALAASGLRPKVALANLVSAVSPVATSGQLLTYALPASDAVLVDEANDVIIARSREKVYAFSRRCPHKGARLEWHANEDRIFCPKHKARFTTDGTHASGRGSDNLHRFSATLQQRQVSVDTGRVFHEQDDPRDWAAAVITL